MGERRSARACGAGGACRASGTGQVRRAARVRRAAQVRLVRGLGSFAAQIRLAASAGEACGQLRVARARERAEVTLLWGGAQCFVCSRLKGRVYGDHRAHRRGFVQLGVLVGHLDRSGLFGGGSTVAWGGRGDRVRLHVVACAYMVGRGRGPSCPPAGWAGDVVSSSAGRRAHGVRREAPGRTRRQRREHMERSPRGRWCRQTVQRAHEPALRHLGL